MADRTPAWRIPPLRNASSHEPRLRLRLARPERNASRRQPLQSTPEADTSDISMADPFAGGDDDDDNYVPSGGYEDEEFGDADEAIEDEQEASETASLRTIDISQLDIAAVDDGMPDIDQTMLPPGFDELEYCTAVEYNDIGFSQDDFQDDLIDSEPFDEVYGAPPATQSISTMPAPNMPGSRRASEHATEDASVLIQHPQRYEITLSDFELALGLMAHFNGVSNRDWGILREIFQLPMSASSGNRDLSRLPQALATLKNQVTKMIPLLDMRVVNVDLKINRLPTMPPSSKGGPQQQAESETQSAKMHFFDPEDLFKKILSSQLRNQLREFIIDPFLNGWLFVGRSVQIANLSKFGYTTPDFKNLVMM